MMQTSIKKQDRSTKKILAILERHYLKNHPSAVADVYRYNSAIIRVRVVDPAFASCRWAERDAEIWLVLKDNLEEDILSQLHMLLLLAPEELDASIMNREFDDPRRLSNL